MNRHLILGLMIACACTPEPGGETGGASTGAETTGGDATVDPEPTSAPEPTTGESCADCGLLAKACEEGGAGDFLCARVTGWGCTHKDPCEACEAIVQECAAEPACPLGQVQSLCEQATAGCDCAPGDATTDPGTGTGEVTGTTTTDTTGEDTGTDAGTSEDAETGTTGDGPFSCDGAPPAGALWGPCLEDNTCLEGTCLDGKEGSLCAPACGEECEASACEGGQCGGPVCVLPCDDDGDCAAFEGTFCDVDVAVDGACIHPDAEQPFLCGGTPMPGEPWGPCLEGGLCDLGDCVAGDLGSICAAGCEGDGCSPSKCDGGECVVDECLLPCVVQADCAFLPGTICDLAASGGCVYPVDGDAVVSPLD